MGESVQRLPSFLMQMVYFEARLCEVACNGHIYFFKQNGEIEFQNIEFLLRPCQGTKSAVIPFRPQLMERWSPSAWLIGSCSPGSFEVSTIVCGKHPSAQLTGTEHTAHVPCTSPVLCTSSVHSAWPVTPSSGHSLFWRKLSMGRQNVWWVLDPVRPSSLNIPCSPAILFRGLVGAFSLY